MGVDSTMTSTYHSVVKEVMHIITEDGPPVLDKVLRMGVIVGRGSGFCLRVELYQPGLQFASKMQNLYLISEPVCVWK